MLVVALGTHTYWVVNINPNRDIYWVVSVQGHMIVLVVALGMYFVNTTNNIVYLFIVPIYILNLFTLPILVLISIVIILMCRIRITNLVTAILIKKNVRI